MADNDLFYQNLAEEVNEVIGEYGKTFIFRRVGAYNHDTLQTLPPTEFTSAGVLASRKDAVQLVSSAGNVPQLISSSYLILSGLVPVERTDVVMINGKPHSCSKIEEVKPADVVVCYMLGLEQ